MNIIKCQKRVNYTLLIIILLFSNIITYAQYNYNIVVVDSVYKEGINDTWCFTNKNYIGTTDESGRLKFENSKPSFKILLRKVGYQDTILNIKHSNQISIIYLSRINLDGIEVAGEKVDPSKFLKKLLKKNAAYFSNEIDTLYYNFEVKTFSNDTYEAVIGNLYTISEGHNQKERDKIYYNRYAYMADSLSLKKVFYDLNLNIIPSIINYRLFKESKGIKIRIRTDKNFSSYNNENIIVIRISKKNESNYIKSLNTDYYFNRKDSAILRTETMIEYKMTNIHKYGNNKVSSRRIINYNNSTPKNPSKYYIKSIYYKDSTYYTEIINLSMIDEINLDNSLNLNMSVLPFRDYLNKKIINDTNYRKASNKLNFLESKYKIKVYK